MTCASQSQSPQSRCSNTDNKNSFLSKICGLGIIDTPYTIYPMRTLHSGHPSHYGHVVGGPFPVLCSVMDEVLKFADNLGGTQRGLCSRGTLG